MKNLLGLAALASFALLPAQTWACATPSCMGLLAGPLSAGSQNPAGTQVLPVAFADPIAMNSVSVVLDLDQALILIDPVGNQDQFRAFGRPDIVILTRAHPDHLSIDTMIGLLRRDTVVLAPQSVIDQLPLMISNNVITPFEVGMSQMVGGIRFSAISTSADVPSDVQVYGRDRGDIGVVIEIGTERAYF